MLHAKRALVASALALVLLLPSQASARYVSYSSSKTVIGNSVVINVNNGTTSVTSSNSCSSSISGYLYQSVLVLFGGNVVYSVTQTSTCP